MSLTGIIQLLLCDCCFTISLCFCTFLVCSRLSGRYTGVGELRARFDGARQSAFVFLERHPPGKTGVGDDSIADLEPG